MRIHCLMMVVALTMMVAACGNKKEKAYGVDLIANPNSAEGYNENTPMPIMTFDNDMHDFGRLSAGESISYSFHFTNTGNADLIITSASATCGCTVADYPKGRIAPKEEGYVTVSFKSAGKSGQQYQEVTIVSNAQPSRNKLRISALVSH